MLSPEECKEKLKDRALAVVAENTGLHYNTLKRLRDGKAKEPSYDTIKTLSEYLQGHHEQSQPGIHGQDP